jgi:ABC-type sugar transport system substrate-binding protein
MKILGIQEVEGTTESSESAMNGPVGRFPQLDAVFAVNDLSAFGAIRTLDAVAKLDNATVVGVDGSADGMAAVKRGRLYSTSALFPKEVGRIAAEKMYEHLAGKPIEKEVVVPVELITRENVDIFSKIHDP